MYGNKSQFSEKIKFTKLLSDSSRKTIKERGGTQWNKITTNITEIQKIHKGILQTVIQIRHPRINAQTSRNIHPSKTESGRNRQSEQINH